jgi:hypothetical protein
MEFIAGEINQSLIATADLKENSARQWEKQRNDKLQRLSLLDSRQGFPFLANMNADGFKNNAVKIFLPGEVDILFLPGMVDILFLPGEVDIFAR